VKNTWAHSLVLVVFAMPLIALALAMANGVPPDWLDPAHTFALLGPGLVLGWFTRRHPLLVGGAAGALALTCSRAAGPMPPALLTGAMTVAVAALAGRALRYRFRAPSIDARLDRAPGS
jgi:hypothetical protein